MSRRSRFALASLCLCFALCGPVAAQATRRGSEAGHPPSVSLGGRLASTLWKLLAVAASCDLRGSIDLWGRPAAFTVTPASPATSQNGDTSPAGTCDNRGTIDPWGCPSS